MIRGWTSRFAAAAAVAACLGTTGLAQQAPATFKGGVTMVTVDVAVFDGDGRPVGGLGAADFEIKLNGRVQPVRLVSFLQAAEPAPAAAPVAAPPRRLELPPGVRAGRQTASNEGAAASQTGEWRVFVILVDDLSFTPQRGRALFAAAQRFVESLPSSDLVGLASTSGTTTVNPTRDRSAVRDLLRRAVGEGQEFGSLFPGGPEQEQFADAAGVVGVSQALNIDSGDLESLKVAIANGCFNGERSQVDGQVLDILIANNTCASQVNRQARTIASLAKQLMRRQVDAYAGIIKAVGAADGIKHVVVLTDGVPIAREFDPLLPVSRAAAAAGVQMSILMEERDMSLSDEGVRSSKPPIGDASSPRPAVDIGAPERRREDNRMYLSGAQTIASLTGGQFHRVIGDPDPFFERVKTASAAFYRLGVEPLPNTTPGREFSVEARVNRRGLHVFVNRHAIAPSPAAAAAAPPSIEDRLKTAISAGQVIGDLPVRLATAVRRAPAGAGAAAGTLELNIHAEIGAAAKAPLVTMVGIATPGKSSMASVRREIAAADADGRYRVVLVTPAAAGSYQVRLAAADAEGAIGSVELPIEARLAEMGPFAASDLFTAWVDGQGQAHLLAVDEIPAAAAKLQVMLELYAPDGAPADALERQLRDNEVEVEITLTKSGEIGPALQMDVIPERSAGVLRAVTEIDSAQIPSGDCQVRARVRSGGRVVGTALAALRKPPSPGGPDPVRR
jgi:VWFA-related protein